MASFKGTITPVAAVNWIDILASSGVADGASGSFILRSSKAVRVALGEADPIASATAGVALAANTAMLLILGDDAQNATCWVSTIASADDAAILANTPVLEVDDFGPSVAQSVNSVRKGNVASAADALVMPLTHAHISKTTGGDAEALTLANGFPGQILAITLVVDGGGTGTLTPATETGVATVIFADVGDRATFMYIDDVIGWVLIGSSGVAAAPVTTV